MLLKNRFKEKDKCTVWIDSPFCAICYSNEGCSLHHIYGTVSKSIFNSIMLCYDHHKEADTFNTNTLGDERKIKLLSITLRFIARSDYKPDKKDIEFLEIIKSDFLKAQSILYLLNPTL